VAFRTGDIGGFFALRWRGSRCGDGYVDLHCCVTDGYASADSDTDGECNGYC
jgi:hypothetical protein